MAPNGDYARSSRPTSRLRLDTVLAVREASGVTEDVLKRFDRREVEEFLLACGTDRLEHPGGTLYEHLARVAALLAEWGAEEVLQYAGLCHACYGTDGYGEVLLSVADRAELAALIGTRAESLVYLYGSCDRRATYPRLADPAPVPFRDRFTGRVVTPVELDIRAFLELTAANELDVVQHNPAIASQHGAALLRLFTCARRRLSDAAWLSCTKLLAPYGSITGPA